MAREPEGKETVNAEADKFGKVIGVGIDCSEMRVTHLRIEVDDDIVKLWGYEKPGLGHLEVLVPVSNRATVSDLVHTKKSLQQIEETIEILSKAKVEFTQMEGNRWRRKRRGSVPIAVQR